MNFEHYELEVEHNEGLSSRHAALRQNENTHMMQALIGEIHAEGPGARATIVGVLLDPAGNVVWKTGASCHAEGLTDEEKQRAFLTRGEGVLPNTGIRSLNDLGIAKSPAKGAHIHMNSFCLMLPPQQRFKVYYGGAKGAVTATARVFDLPRPGMPAETPAGHLDSINYRINQLEKRIEGLEN